jgi:transcriptional repressor NrdR
MHCPYCRHTDTRVLDSRVADDGGAIRRRRSCNSDNGGCGKRFSTVEQMQLVVLKRSGATEPFTRDKAISGVRKACKGRPVTEDDLACLGQQVEDTLRVDGWAEVPAHEVGMAILSPLRELDEVAYLRFASVYRAFESADDFEAEIAVLRAERAASLVEPDQAAEPVEANRAHPQPVPVNGG